MPSISFVRPELQKRMREYALINDAIAGEQTIKSKNELYLPAPEPTNTQAGKDRYYGYKTRAVFYNVTARTRQGLLGQLFNRPPQIDVPAYLAGTVANMDGLGVNAVQQCKSTSGEVVALGRAGLLSDFPTVEEGKEVTAQDLQTGRIAPTITFYPATSIINWRYYRDFMTKKLLFVILEERREIYQTKGFAFTVGKQWRVLRLDDDGYYIQELYFQDSADPVLTTKPTDYAGNRFTEIPFRFIGAEDNDPDIDEAPMYSLASLNIAHFRNSADFEDSLFFVGQPTVIINGLTQGWLDQNLQGTIKLGSRNAIPLPAGGDIKLVQADPNNLALQGMEQKEKQMVALGAKLVENKQVQRTATEANQEEAAETSVLGTVADNTSVAYAEAFAFCGRFVSGNDTEINFKINTAFEVAAMDFQARAETVKEWQQSAISFSEMRAVLRRGGIATLSDDDAKKAIAEDEAMRALSAAAANPPNIQDPTGDTGPTGPTGANK
jgi:hypothetical protein